MKPLRVIELFSGVEAQRIAFNIVSERTGLKFDFVAQCEIDKYAVKSYNAIHGETPNLGDITKVDKLPECDILTWSFPCQSLSIGIPTGCNQSNLNVFFDEGGEKELQNNTRQKGTGIGTTPLVQNSGISTGGLPLD